MKLSDGAEGFVESWLRGRGRLPSDVSASSSGAVFSLDSEGPLEKTTVSGVSSMPRNVVVNLPASQPLGGSQQTVVSVETKEVIPKAQALHTPALVDTKTGERITLNDAIARGIFDLKTGQIIDSATGKYLPLTEAVRRGLISDDLARELQSRCGLKDPSTGRELTLLEAIQRGLYNPSTGFVIESSTGRMLSLDDAVNAGVLKQEAAERLSLTPVLSTSASHSIGHFGLPSVQGSEVGLSLTEAINSGFYDPHTGKFIDPISKEPLTLSEAISRQLLDALKKEIIHPVTGEKLSLNEAIAMGVIDPNTGALIDPRTGRTISLIDASKKHLLQPPMLLHTALTEGVMNMDGDITDSKTGKRMKLLEAMERGLLDTEFKCILDPRTNELLSLAEALRRGLINSEGEFVHPVLKKRMSLCEAINRGMTNVVGKSVHFAPHVIVDTITGENLTLEDAVQRGFVDFEKGLFTDKKTGQRMSFEEAARKGFMDSKLLEQLQSESGLKDASGRSLLVKEALQQSRFKLNTGKVVDLRSGSLVTIEQAVSSGLISGECATRLLHLSSPMVTTTVITTEVKPVPLNVLQPISMKDALRLNLIDDDTDIFIDPRSKTKMPVSEAIRRGLLKPGDEQVFNESFESADHDTSAYKADVSSADERDVDEKKVRVHVIRDSGRSTPKSASDSGMRVVPIAVAYDKDKQSVDEHYRKEESDKYSRSVDGGKEDIEWHKKHEYHARKIAGEGVEIVAIHESKTSHVTSTSKSSLAGQLKYNMPLFDALDRDLLDRHSGHFHDDSGGVGATLQGGINQGIIDPQSAVFQEPSSERRYSLKEALDGKLLDSTGHYQHKLTKKSYDLDALISASLLRPATGKVPVIIEEKRVTKGKDSCLTPKHQDACNFNVTGAVDSITGKMLDLNDALRTGVIDQTHGEYVGQDERGNEFRVPLKEAVRTGLVIGEHVPEGMPAKIEQETKTINVQQVYDSSKQEMVSVGEALKRGLIDPNTGAYKNPVTGEAISVANAIDQGYIVADVVASIESGKEPGSEVFLSQNEDYTLTSVIDPLTSKPVDAIEAVRKGLYDPQTSMYCDPRTGEKIPLQEAEKRGLVELAVGRPDVQPQQRERADSISIDDQANAKAEIVSEDIREHQASFEIAGIYDPSSGLTIDYEQAVAMGILDTNRCLYIDPLTGNAIPIAEALQQGLVVGEMKKTSEHEIFKSDVVAEPLDVTNINGILDPRTGQILSIDDAVACGLVDRDRTSYRDPITGAVTSLQEAFNKGLINPLNAGRENNKLLAEELLSPVIVRKEAAERKQPNDGITLTIQTTAVTSMPVVINEDSTTEVVSSSGLAEGSMSFDNAVKLGLYDVRNGLCMDPNTGTKMCLLDAVAAGILAPEQSAIVDLVGQRNFTLNEAISQNMLDRDSGKLNEKVVENCQVHLDPLFTVKGFTVRPLHLLDAVNSKLCSLNHGMCRDPRSGKLIPFSDWLNSGLIDGQSVYVIHPVTEERFSLEQAVTNKLVNKKTGDIEDNATGKKLLSLQQAVEVGLIESTIDKAASLWINPKTGSQEPLIDAMKDKLIKAERVLVYDPAQRTRVPLSNAVDSKVVDFKLDRMKIGSSNRKIPLSDALKLDVIHVSGTPVLECQQTKIERAVLTEMQTRIRTDSALQLKEKTIVPRGQKILLSQSPVKSNDTSILKYTESSAETVPKTLSADGNEFSSSEKVTLRTERRLVKDSANKPFVTAGEAIKSKSENYQPALFAKKFPTNNISELPSETDDAKPVTNEDGILSQKQNMQKPDVPLISSSGEPKTEDDGHNVGKKTVEDLAEVDWKTGTVINTRTGQKMSADEAAQLGLIDDHILQLIKQNLAKKPQHLGDKMTLNEAFTQGLVNVPLGRIENPLDGHRMTIEEAIDIGFLDADRSLIIDPSTGETLSLTEAFRRGIMDPHTGNVINSATGTTVTLTEMSLEGLIPEHSLNFTAPVPFGIALERGLVDLKTGLYKDPSSGRLISLDKAIELNLLIVEDTKTVLTATYRNKDNSHERMDFDESEKPMYIDTDMDVDSLPYDETDMENKMANNRGTLLNGNKTVTHPYGFEKPNNQPGAALNKGKAPAFLSDDDQPIAFIPNHDAIDWNEAMNKNLVNLENNTFLEPITDVLMPLDAAIRKGYFINVPSSVLGQLRQKGDSDDEPNSGTVNIVAITDPETGKPMSLQEAINRGIFVGGQIIVPNTGEVIPLDEALELGLVVTDKEPEWDGDNLVGSVEDAGDMNIKSVFDPLTNQLLHPAAAVERGLLNMQDGTYIDPRTGDQMPLHEALRRGLIDAELANDGKQWPVATTGELETKHYNIVAAVDTRNGEHVNVPEAIQRQLLDPQLKMYTDPSTNESMTIPDAINCGLVLQDNNDDLYQPQAVINLPSSEKQPQKVLHHDDISKKLSGKVPAEQKLEPANQLLADTVDELERLVQEISGMDEALLPSHMSSDNSKCDPLADKTNSQAMSTSQVPHGLSGPIGKATVGEFTSAKDANAGSKLDKHKPSLPKKLKKNDSDDHQDASPAKLGMEISDVTEPKNYSQKNEQSPTSSPEKIGKPTSSASLPTDARPQQKADHENRQTSDVFPQQHSNSLNGQNAISPLDEMMADFDSIKQDIEDIVAPKKETIPHVETTWTLEAKVRDEGWAIQMALEEDLLYDHPSFRNKRRPAGLNDDSAEDKCDETVSDLQLPVQEMRTNANHRPSPSNVGSTEQLKPTVEELIFPDTEQTIKPRIEPKEETSLKQNQVEDISGRLTHVKPDSNVADGLRESPAEKRSISEPRPIRDTYTVSDELKAKPITEIVNKPEFRRADTPKSGKQEVPSLKQKTKPADKESTRPFIEEQTGYQPILPVLEQGKQQEKPINEYNDRPISEQSSEQHGKPSNGQNVKPYDFQPGNLIEKQVAKQPEDVQHVIPNENNVLNERTKLKPVDDVDMKDDKRNKGLNNNKPAEKQLSNDQQQDKPADKHPSKPGLDIPSGKQQSKSDDKLAGKPGLSLPSGEQQSKPADKQAGKPGYGLPSGEQQSKPGNLQHGISEDKQLGKPEDFSRGKSQDKQLSKPEDLQRGKPGDKQLGKPEDLQLGTPDNKQLGKPEDLHRGNVDDKQLGKPEDLQRGKSDDKQLGKPEDLQFGERDDKQFGRPDGHQHGKPGNEQLGRLEELQRDKRTDEQMGQCGKSTDNQSGKPEDSQHGKPTNKQLGRPANLQNVKSTDEHVGKPEDLQYGKPSNKELGKHSELYDIQNDNELVEPTKLKPGNDVDMKDNGGDKGVGIVKPADKQLDKASKYQQLDKSNDKQPGKPDHVASSDEQLGIPGNLKIGKLNEQLGKPDDSHDSKPTADQLGKPGKLVGIKQDKLGDHQHGKPGDKQLGREDQHGKPTDNLLEKSEDLQLGKPTDNQLSRPEDLQHGKPTGKHLGKPENSQLDKPADNQLGKPEYLQQGQPTDKPLDKPKDIQRGKPLHDQQNNLQVKPNEDQLATKKPLVDVEMMDDSTDEALHHNSLEGNEPKRTALVYDQGLKPGVYNEDKDESSSGMTGENDLCSSLIPGFAFTADGRVLDVKAGDVMSLSEAIQRGIANPDNLQVTDGGEADMDIGENFSSKMSDEEVFIISSFVYVYVV